MIEVKHVSLNRSHDLAESNLRRRFREDVPSRHSPPALNQALCLQFVQNLNEVIGRYALSPRDFIDLNGVFVPIPFRHFLNGSACIIAFDGYLHSIPM